MILSHITLQHFRNFPKASCNVHPNMTIIIGENARGKTNLLESIFFSMNGEGFRETKEEELLEWGASDAYVETVWTEGDQKNLFQIHLARREERTEKKFYVDKTLKSHFQYRQYLGKAVLFAPEHIEIISGPPDKRRDYINKIISLYSIEYKKTLRNYEHALRKRNKVLEHHQNIASLKQELSFWDTYLIEHAEYIRKEREAYVAYINSHPDLQGNHFHLKYMKNELNRARLDHYFDLETKTRKTVVGPQKDDFQISLTKEEVEKNIHHFGSRSEQRLGVYWLKLNEIQYLEEYFKKRPILLLDDIFSELDMKNKRLTMELTSKYQTVLTTTEAELLHLSHLPQSSIAL
ncbi:MAG: recombination protein replication and repair protein RecF [Candidatus Parcubacteria bacterium]|jgi:DNA replication and repair protein RecF